MNNIRLPILVGGAVLALLVSGLFIQSLSYTPGYHEARSYSYQAERLDRRAYRLQLQQSLLEARALSVTPQTENNDDISEEPDDAATTPVSTPAVTDTESTVATPAEPVEAESVESDPYLAAIAAEIHRLTNRERARAGVPVLTFSNALTVVATEHSEDMIERNFFAHTNPDGCNAGCRLEAAGYDYSYWGENIAWRSSSQLPEAEALAAIFVENWMNSSSHRKNLLSRNFTEEGIGMAQIGNKVYATVNFADPR